MKAIVTHLSSDFDSFAALVAAKKLYPDADIILPSAINSNVRKFITLYEDELPVLKDAKDISVTDIDHLIIVDTKYLSRLGAAGESIRNSKVKVTIFDHHAKSPEDIIADDDYSTDIGASTTIIVEQIKNKKIPVSPLEATLFSLGIYEDTGSFTYPGTTSRDLEAAAYLFGKGANLFVLLKFLNLSLTAEQHGLLEELIMNARKVKINETEVMLSHAKTETYIEGLSVLTRKLSQIEDVSIVICWARMKDKIYVVARSDNRDIDVSRVLKALGGGGHPQAASAVLSGFNYDRVEEIVIKSLKENIRKPLLARDIMSYPVRVVNEDLSISEVDKMLRKYGHSGIPIVNENRNLVGVITRKDVDKAIGHGLSHAPVKGFRSHSIVRASPNTNIEKIQNMMIENGIGRVPIIDKKEIIGIITRKDILRYLHGRSYHEILKLFPEKVERILKIISQATRVLRYKTYLVGGIVRDALLEIPNFDIDIVVEGDGIKFGQELARRFDCRLETHQKFKTAVLVLKDGQHIDIATSRVEYYKSPGALPSVETGSIKQDLSRRDFTINTMAISLNRDNYGEILDYFGAREDLKNKKIRVLHKMSFIEDPTRIFRAVRFEKRLGFKMDHQTEKLARTTIEMDIVSKLNGVRIRDELFDILDEDRPWGAIRRLYDLGALARIGINKKIDAGFSVNLKKALMNFEELKVYFADNIKKWRVILLFLLSDMEIDKVSEWCLEMKIKNKDTKVIVESLKKKKLAGRRLKNIITRNSTLYQTMQFLPFELQIMIAGYGAKYYKNISRYLRELAGVKLEIDGRTLIEMGYRPSKKFKKVLKKLFVMKLNGRLKNGGDAVKQAKLLMAEK